MEKNVKYYSFDYYGWIPDYRDFDQGWYMCKAESEEQAWKKFWDKHKYIRDVIVTEMKSIENETSN